MTTPDPAPPAGREGESYVPAIDGLRAIAIAAVVVFHLRPALLPGGFTGVDLFFAISGFVVTTSVARRSFARRRDLFAYFYTRRVLRILPALLVMLLVVSLLAAVFLRRHGMWMSRDGAWPAFFGASNVALALAGQPYFAQQADFSPFLHTWTLGVEEQFYLVFPLLFVLAPRRRLLAVAALSAASLALCRFLAGPSPLFAFYLMPPRLWELGAGVALALAMHRWRPALGRMGRATGAVAAAACFAALAVAFSGVRGTASPLPAAILPVAGGVGLMALVCARPASLLSRALAHPVPAFTGRISYSLYLWHWPVFVLFRWTVGLDGAARATSALLLSVVAALASYFLVEQPFRRAGAANRVRRRVVLLGGAAAAVAGAVVSAAIFAAQPSFASVTASDAYWGDDRPALRCPVAERSEGFAGGMVHTLVPACPAPGPGRALFVAGDSHAEAYSRMLARYAADTGTRVTIHFRVGCEFLGLSAPVAEKPWCAEYHRTLVGELSRRLRPGDLLFMPSMRVPRFRTHWTGEPLPGWTVTPAQRAAAYRDAEEALATLSASGARLVFGAPLPVFRSQPYRCSDWFNRHNPVCSPRRDADRAELLALRAPVIAAMARLAATVPGVAVWDAFPLLCPTERCSAYRGGRPLYIDYDHLSGNGNDVVAPSFRRMADGPK